jgi:hypothetical protein
MKRFDVDLMYSFIISSSPQALLFFKFLKQQPNIEINTLYEFFKDLNTKGLDEQQSTTLQNELPNDSNVHINGYISQNEIFKCIKNLKNNKACGEDEIINEFQYCSKQFPQTTNYCDWSIILWVFNIAFVFINWLNNPI